MKTHIPLKRPTCLPTQVLKLEARQQARKEELKRKQAVKRVCLSDGGVDTMVYKIQARR